MTVAPVSAASGSNTAFNLSFQSLLQIILTQLQYQDPLQPLDNFQFVSQLAQFAQLQQTQSLNDSVTNLLASQSTMEAVTLLGRTADLTTTNDQSGAATAATGTVSAVSFSNGQISFTVTTSSGQALTGISLSQITQLR